MSYHSRYGGGSDRYGSGGDRYGDSRRHSSSSRRDSSPRRRSRRSRSPSPGPSRSPKPRDPKELPESFGRVEESSRLDDDLSVLQRMRSSYENSPLQSLFIHLEKKDKVKIWTRNYKEVRGVMTGYIVAFDKHWNILLSDVDEVFLKPKKSKTPFLRDIAPNENLPDIPPRVPKKKGEEKAQPPPPPQPKKEGSAKKRQRSKKPKATSEKRQVAMLFIRGDNIVIISPAEDDDDDVEEEEEVPSAEEEGQVKSETG